jgi:hypothetical protein
MLGEFAELRADTVVRKIDDDRNKSGVGKMLAY